MFKTPQIIHKIKLYVGNFFTRNICEGAQKNESEVADALS